MRLVWRRLRRGELDHELIWLAVGLAAALAGLVWLRLGLPTPVCNFESLTGVPCATCGSTRCFESLAHGRPLAALHWNPLVFALSAGFALFLCYAAATLALRLPRLRVTGMTAAGWRRLGLLILAALLANWGYILWLGPHAN